MVHYPTLAGNMRDRANIHQLLCLANMESMNTQYISEGVSLMKQLQN
jgi:hypothetical protein